MMNKKHIYQYLLLPLLACLMAGTAGCSSDASEGEVQSSPDGNTHITFTTRGIVTENPVENGAITDYDAFDSYIQSLRIIGFCNGEVKYNQLFKATESGDAKAWTLVNDDNEIDITDILSSPVNGVYTFYFIANEEGHTVAGSADNLADKLMASDLTPSVLDGMGINFTADEITGGTPLIMTQKQSFLIRVGQTNSITNVELVRALAKAQLEIRKEEANTNDYGNVSASITQTELGKIHSSYALMAESTYSGSEALKNITTGIFIGENGNLPTENGYIYFYESNPIYLPEKNLEEAANAINITTSITNGSSTPYDFPIGDPNKNFSIERNTEYTTIVTFLTLYDFSFNCMTISWGEKTMEVPPFE